jgi:ribokinase
MSRILNFGSLNIDYTYTVERFVQAGETISSADMRLFCGGKGLNQSIALARAGAEVYHAGFVGRGDGEILIQTLAASGVCTDLIEKRDCPSGHAIIQVDATGQNCILLYGGANQTNSEEYIDYVLARFGTGDMVVLQNEINLNACIMEKAKQKGLKVALNPSPADKTIAQLPLALLDYLILNEVEAASICDAYALESGAVAIASLRTIAPQAAVLLTLGRKGALYMDNELRQPIGQDIFDVPVVDTTAAGDTFLGYFLAHIVSGAPANHALRVAAAAASLAVSRPGAAASIPMLAEAMQIATSGHLSRISATNSLTPTAEDIGGKLSSK